MDTVKLETWKNGRLAAHPERSSNNPSHFFLLQTRRDPVRWFCYIVSRPYLYLSTFQEYRSSTDTNYKAYYIECTSNHPKIWLGVIYAYKGLMLAFGALMAWETRNVTFPALNDSKHIGISVYNVVFPCVLGMTIVNVVDYNPNVFYVVLSVLVVFCTTITLCIVFVPKVMLAAI